MIKFKNIFKKNKTVISSDNIQIKDNSSIDFSMYYKDASNVVSFYTESTSNIDDINLIYKDCSNMFGKQFYPYTNNSHNTKNCN